MFNRDNVSLVPHAVVEVAPDGLIDDTGTKRPADVLILSTGFQAASYLSTVRIQGRGGRDLHDVWAGEPWAFLGVTVPGFPNFFMLYGPNTNGGFSMTTQLEIQAEQLVRVVRRLRRTSALDTRPRLAERVDRWVQGQIAVTMSSAGAGCRNYYHAASGKNVTQWPRSHTVYRIALRALSHWVLTARAGGT
jgi:cation diffusion facilitator CzcD-associated flavoprotein CzcO